MTGNSFTPPSNYYGSVLTPVTSSANGNVYLDSTNHGIAVTKVGTWVCDVSGPWVLFTITTTKTVSGDDTWSYRLNLLGTNGSSTIYGFITGNYGYRIIGDFSEQMNCRNDFKATSSGIAPLNISIESDDTVSHAAQTAKYLTFGQLFLKQ